MSNPNPPRTWRPRWWWRGFIALAGYAFFLGWNFSAVAGGADSSGYLNSARLLASGQLAGQLRTPAEFGPPEGLRRQQFQPHGFVPFDGNPRLSPTYPVGLPLHLALAGKLFGWPAAPVVVGVGAALAALLLCHAVGRQLGLDPCLSATTAILLAAFPVFIFTSIQPLSDTLAATWCLATVFAAMRAGSRPGWAVACGAAFAIAVFVRATNALLLPALLAILGFNFRRLLLVAAGGIPGALWLAYYNHQLYGSALRSGYVDIAQAFGWKYGPPTLVHFGWWLAVMLPAVVLLLPFAAIGTRPAPARLLLALVLWLAAFVVVYAFYEISHEVWWDLRFILPGVPALLLAAMLGVDALARRKAFASVPRFRALVAAGLVVWGIGLGAYWTSRFHVLLIKSYEQAYADASAAARAHFPPNTLVLAGQHSGALYYYTDFPVLRWEFVNPAEFARFRELAGNARRPIGALLYDLEEREALREKCPGNWVRIATLNNIGLWRLDP